MVNSYESLGKIHVLSGKNPLATHNLEVRRSAPFGLDMNWNMHFVTHGDSNAFFHLSLFLFMIFIFLLFLFLSGLFVPFARSGKVVVFCGLLSLIFGHLLTIGSAIHFSPSHLPIQQFVRNQIIGDNCTWAVPYPKLNLEDSR